jgi:hypothetical protein
MGYRSLTPGVGLSGRFNAESNADLAILAITLSVAAGSSVLPFT